MNIPPFVPLRPACCALAAALMLGTPATAQSATRAAPAAVSAPASARAATAGKGPQAARKPLSADAQKLLHWVRQTGDNRGQPFAVIDKRNARLHVFEPGGRLRGTAPVLLGIARGDDTAPGVGDKKLSEVLFHERTTPAGRFVAEHGMNARGENVIWIDYDAAVSMHRVLTTNPKERRLRRLATPSAADNRISYGCVNVPKRFFEDVLVKTLKTPRPVVYVLPETRPLDATFAGMSGAGKPVRRAAVGSAPPGRQP
ncbi:MAG: hypothetical protein AB1430_22095 [Pseudomonadota bacterium]